MASTSSHLILRGAAITATGIAVVMDVGLDEHPTHLVVLGFVAIVVAAVHMRFRRQAIALSTLSAVSAGLAAQPLLHLTSKLDHPPIGTHDDGSLLHVVASDAPVAGVQVIVPVVALIAVAVTAHLLHLLLDTVRSPQIVVSAPFEAPRNLSTSTGHVGQGFVELVGSGLLIHTAPGSAGGSGCLWTNLSGWVS